MTGLEPLTQELIWLAIPAIVLAALVHGTFGIGFPMVATPLLALFTDVLTAVLITLLPTMTVNLTMIMRGGMERLKDIRQHLLIIPFTLLGTVVGTLLLLWLDPRPFLLLLAAAILLYLNQDRLQNFNFGWVHHHTILSYVLFGLTAGLMAGTVNVMVPVLIILFLELRIASASMVVLFNINFFSGKLTQCLLFLQQELPGIGLFLLTTLWLVPVAIFSLYLGTRLRKRITEDRYLKVLRGILWVMAGILFARFFYAYLLPP
ncbi:MAG: sulfite exporter TauE/SafE family protein [Gammaproteobacteria bacterium]|nr:MAG: sulfite exporter TauE/SafE family protein [Gammaproteobacteria bacterium]